MDDKLIAKIKKFVDYVRAHENHNKATKDYAEKIYKDIIDLEFEMSFDNLTGLFGRHQFQKILEKEASFTERTGSPFVFIMIDLVGLKHVNDTYSRTTGDEYIKFAADWLKENTRESDIVCVGRFDDGADEFGIISREKNVNVAKLIKRLRDKLKDVMFEKKIPLGFAMGGAIYKRGNNLDVILEKAEIALNKDKINLKKKGYKVRV